MLLACLLRGEGCSNISFLFIVPPLAVLMRIVCVSSYYFPDPSHCAYIIPKNLDTIPRGYSARRAQSLYRFVPKLHSSA